MLYALLALEILVLLIIVFFVVANMVFSPQKRYPRRRTSGRGKSQIPDKTLKHYRYLCCFRSCYADCNQHSKLYQFCKLILYVAGTSPCQ